MATDANTTSYPDVSRRNLAEIMARNPGLATFLFQTRYKGFTRRGMEEMLNYSRAEANYTIHTLWAQGMISKIEGRIHSEIALILFVAILLKEDLYVHRNF
jgi:hypothetical protein